MGKASLRLLNYSNLPSFEFVSDFNIRISDLDIFKPDHP